MTERIDGCWWCHGPVVRQRTGRWRKYCSHSCRQRAYEQRKLNRAADWVAFGERCLDHVQGRLDSLEATWRPLIDSATSEDARALWSDLLDARYPIARAQAHDVGVCPRPDRPVWRDIGDGRWGRTRRFAERGT